jgi:hypothetical protein
VRTTKDPIVILLRTSWGRVYHCELRFTPGRREGGNLGAGTVIGGVVILILGLLFTATIIGAIIGIPLIIIGIVVIAQGARPAPPPVVYYQAPPPPPPMYYQPSPPVVVNVQQASHGGAPPPPQVMFRCRYCQNVYPEAAGRCPRCGAGF